MRPIKNMAGPFSARPNGRKNVISMPWERALVLKAVSFSTLRPFHPVLNPFCFNSKAPGAM